MSDRFRIAILVLSMAISACSRDASDVPLRGLAPSGVAGQSAAANPLGWTAEVNAKKTCYRPGETIKFTLRVFDENNMPPQDLARSTDFTIFTEDGEQVVYSGVVIMDDNGVSTFVVSTADWAEGNYYINGWASQASGSLDFRIRKQCVVPKKNRKGPGLIDRFFNLFK